MSEIVSTGTVLDRIIARKQKEVEAIKAEGASTASKASPARGFRAAVMDRERLGRPVIAEIKRASPSEGVIREDFRPASIARAYADAGARCISVLTDTEFFQGSLTHLAEAREACDLPVLRKDFIIDEVQVKQTAAWDADCMLLIVRILADGLLQRLYTTALSLGLEVLLEVHDRKDLERALQLTPPPALLGVNNRDLSDFSVSVERTLSLLPHVPAGASLISESGLSDAGMLDELLAAGVSGFLIGTALMRERDEGAALRSLVY
ncbi:MAG: indole-3-glycerol phosphate synthase TrpC [bacterium]